jgi:hypothetical protein
MASTQVHNLTDVETPTLRQYGLVEQSIAVGPALLAPGQSMPVDDAHLQHIRPGLQRLVSAGALALGQPPPAYLLAKEKARTAAPKPAQPGAPPTTARSGGTPTASPHLAPAPTAPVPVPPANGGKG